MEGDFMPSSVTHSYFGIDVYNKLNKNIRNKLKGSLNNYKCFAQGPDSYYFYDFHLSRHGKKAYEINTVMQHSKINDHFISLINYINDKNYYSNSEVMAYLYGQICHYVLDSTAHPFIIYNTGIYNESNPNTYKYNGLHAEIEYYIDIYLINEREKISPRKYKVYKEVFTLSKFNTELNDTIDNVIKDVYNYDNASKIYYKSLSDMKKFFHIFNYDRFGIKKLVYKFIDYIFKDKFVRKEELSFCVEPNSKLHYLNESKATWYHPCNKSESYNYSFFDLYNIAMEKAIHIIEYIDKSLKNKAIDDDELGKILGDLDYGTGKDWKLNLEYKYFKF